MSRKTASKAILVSSITSLGSHDLSNVHLIPERSGVQTLPIPIHISCTTKVICFYLDLSCLMYLSVRVRQQSKLSSSFQVAPNCGAPPGTVGCVLPFREAGGMGWQGPYEIQQGQKWSSACRKEWYGPGSNSAEEDLGVLAESKLSMAQQHPGLFNSSMASRWREVTMPFYTA